MRRGGMFVCDRCGEKAPGVDGDAPARWIRAYGWSAAGPHACSSACWSRIQAAHRLMTGKIYIPDTRPPSDAIEPAPVVIMAPATFTPIDALEDIDVPVVHRVGERARGEPRADAGLRRESAAENPPPPPREMGGRRDRKKFLYFVQEMTNGPVKIGVSAAPLTRLSSLQVSNPRQLKMLGIRPGSHADEIDLHRRLAEHRIRGEWFNPAAEVLAAITGA